MTVSDAHHFRALAIQHCTGLIAQIKRAERCQPGCTGGALAFAENAMRLLCRGFEVKPFELNPMDPRDTCVDGPQPHQEPYP